VLLGHYLRPVAVADRAQALTGLAANPLISGHEAEPKMRNATNAKRNGLVLAIAPGKQGSPFS
jgi:hypothetical protein